MIIDGCLIII